MISSSKTISTRQAILHAAHTLFLERGFAATSMRQIAHRAGLALGGIYNHFSSKEAIFFEILSLHHPYRYILPVLLHTPCESPEQFVRCAAKTLIEELNRHPDFLKLMFIEIVEFGGKNIPTILQSVLPEVEILLRRLEQQSRSLLRPLPPVILLRAFLGLFFSYYVTGLLLANTPFNAAKLDTLDHFVEIFLHGILAERPAA